MEPTPPPRPAESPFILEKHYKNARAARAAAKVVARQHLHPCLCTGSPSVAQRPERECNWSSRAFFEEITADCGKVTLREIQIAGRVRAMRKAAREVRNHEFPPPRWSLLATFAGGDRFGLLSRVRREADIRFLRSVLL